MTIKYSGSALPDGELKEEPRSHGRRNDIVSTYFSDSYLHDASLLDGANI